MKSCSATLLPELNIKTKLDVAKLILEYNATVVAKKVEGLTPLHIAAQSGYEILFYCYLL